MVIFILFFVILPISHRASRNLSKYSHFSENLSKSIFCRDINIYLKINFYLYIYHHTIILFTHALIGVFSIIRSLMPVNVIQHRWAVGNFNNHFNFRKFKSKSDSLLGICPLLKKIVHVLIFYILSHVVSGFSNISGWPFNW